MTVAAAALELVTGRLRMQQHLSRLASGWSSERSGSSMIAAAAAAPFDPAAAAAASSSRAIHTTAAGSSDAAAAAAAAAASTSTSSSGSSSPSPSTSTSTSSSSSDAFAAALAAAGPDGGACLASPRSGDWAEAAARAPALSLLHRHFNIGAPRFRGQAVLARVVRSAAGGAVLLDPGYYGLSPVPRHELGSAAEYGPDGAPLPPRSSGGSSTGAGRGGLLGVGGGGSSALAAMAEPSSSSAPRLRRGALVKVRIGQTFTPFGDVELRPVRAKRDVPLKLVWEELRACMERGAPVRGRVLNACAGGYAVGVAGFVALLPSRQASINNIQSIGTLQQFYVHRMDWRRRRIELSNYAAGGAAGGDDGADAGLWSNL